MSGGQLVLLLWMQVCAAQFGVDPNFALAVAAIESRLDANLETRQVCGLFGLNKANVREKFGLDARDPLVNVLIGVRALRGRDKIKVLHRYNATWWRDNYVGDVMRLYAQLQRGRQVAALKGWAP